MNDEIPLVTVTRGRRSFYILLPTQDKPGNTDKIITLTETDNATYLCKSSKVTREELIWVLRSLKQDKSIDFPIASIIIVLAGNKAENIEWEKIEEEFYLERRINW